MPALCTFTNTAGVRELVYCVECQLKEAMGTGGSAPESLPTQTEILAHLLQSADAMHELRLRQSIKTAYARGVRGFVRFCGELGVQSLLATQATLRAFISHQILEGRLDPRTVSCQIAAISDWHNKQREVYERAGREVPPNPCQLPGVQGLLATCRQRLKREPKGRLPITKEEFT